MREDAGATYVRFEVTSHMSVLHRIACQPLAAHLVTLSSLRICAQKVRVNRILLNKPVLKTEAYLVNVPVWATIPCVGHSLCQTGQLSAEVCTFESKAVA